jgi:hypothetical protein
LNKRILALEFCGVGVAGRHGEDAILSKGLSSMGCTLFRNS